MHQRRELESLEIHRRIVRRMMVDAMPVLDKARANLGRWLESRPADAATSAYREWEALLATLEPQEIADLLVSQDERAIRLRQSSPFAGVLTPQEVWEIKREHRHAAA